MAFVREVINTEEDKKIFDSFNLITPHSPEGALPSRARIGLTRWVVDSENGIVMRPLGGGSFEEPNYYILILPEGRVVFEAYRKGKTVTPPEPNLHNNKSYVASFQVDSIGIPPQLQHRKKELLDMIKKTLAVDEGVDRADGALAVEVNFHTRYTAE